MGERGAVVSPPPEPFPIEGEGKFCMTDVAKYLSQSAHNGGRMQARGPMCLISNDALPLCPRPTRSPWAFLLCYKAIGDVCRMGCRVTFRRVSVAAAPG
jgi:hypothetical protein